MDARDHGPAIRGLLNGGRAAAFWTLLGLAAAVGCQKPADTSPKAQAAAGRDAKGSPAASAAPGAASAAADFATEAIPAPAAAKAPRNADAGKILDAMVKTYRSAASYSDEGHLRVTGHAADQSFDSENAFSVVLERPNKVRLQAYLGTVVGDGRKIWGFVDTLPNQVLSLPSPERIGIDSVFADQQLGAALSYGLTQMHSWVPPQLVLLLAADPLKTLLHDAGEPRLLPPVKFDGHVCEGVAADRPDGRIVFWIDRENHLLRRVEYPTQEINQQMANGQIQDFSVKADFKNAQVGAKILPPTFEFQKPESAEVVGMLLPTELGMLGKPAAKFAFALPDGGPVTPESLAGQAVVLDFWGTNCPPCRAGLPLLQKVYERYKDNPKVAIRAVNVDPYPPEEKGKEARQADNKEVQGVLDELKVKIPLLRDPNQDAGRLFAVSAIPTTVVLGPKGTIQSLETGLDERLETTLPERLDKLLAGEDVFQAVLDKRVPEMKAAQQQYRKWLTARTNDGAYWGPLGMETDQAEIAPRTEPQSLRIKPLWSCQELKLPGNLLIVARKDGPPRILVLDEGTSVAELDPNGKVAARYPLRDRKNDAPISFLRTAVDKDGTRWFAAAASWAQQFDLYKDKFQFVLGYPEDALENPHAGIFDVQLGDLDGDGRPKAYVAYWGVVGVQGVSLEGQRLWANRSLATVARVAIVRPGVEGGASLICTNEKGTLVMLDAQGQTQRTIRLPDRVVHWIVAEDLDGDGRTELCGLAPTPEGDVTAVGLTSEGKVLWSYPLYKGRQEHAIEQVLAGQVRDHGPRQWLLAGSDGTIHVLQADGTRIDRFSYGESLTGLATVRLDGHPVLLVATPKQVDAWLIEGERK